MMNFTINLILRIFLQDIFRRVVLRVLVNISPSNTLRLCFSLKDFIKVIMLVLADGSINELLTH